MAQQKKKQNKTFLQPLQKLAQHEDTAELHTAHLTWLLPPRKLPDIKVLQTVIRNTERSLTDGAFASFSCLAHWLQGGCDAVARVKCSWTHNSLWLLVCVSGHNWEKIRQTLANHLWAVNILKVSPLCRRTFCDPPPPLQRLKPPHAWPSPIKPLQSDVFLLIRHQSSSPPPVFRLEAPDLRTASPGHSLPVGFCSQ